MACKEGQFYVVELLVNELFKTFSINLNAQHVNGMTPFDLALSTVIRYSRVVKTYHWCQYHHHYRIVLYHPARKRPKKGLK